MNTRLAFVVSFACISWSAVAQQAAPIERIKITDNQLNCAQIYGETGEMDKVIAAAQAAGESGSNTAMAGSVANVAAEVAGRTGLFGQIGGMAGALFGKAAAQTAAGVAQQSGQMTTQQSAERVKQALARKEYLTSVFVGRGCKVSDLNYNPPATEPQANAASAVMQASLVSGQPKSADPVAIQKLFAPIAAVTNLPELDPDQHFKGKMGGTFGADVVQVMPNSKRVAVAGFRVIFITENTVTATVRGSYMPGRDTSGASSTLHLVLNGVDYGTMQSITDKAYADFLGQLRFAGREVVPQDELKEFLSGVEVSSTPGKPYTTSVNNQTGLGFSPASLPLWFSNADAQWGDKSPFQQGNLRRLAEHAVKLKAIVIAPLIVVNFARMGSSGNRSGFTTNAAETSASLAMHVTAFNTHYMRSDESRGGLVMKGDEGGIQMAAPIISNLEFGSLKEVAATDNSAIKGTFDILGRSMGMANAGGANRSKSENVAETNGAAYGAAAVDALGRATGTFAKWFQKYPAR